MTGGPSHSRFRTALIVTQVALTLVLLAGASTFGYGIRRLLTPDVGWSPAPLLAGRLLLAGHDNERERLIFFRRLQKRLAVLPGVRTASVDVDLPLFGFLPGQRAYVVEGRERPAPGKEATALIRRIALDRHLTVLLIEHDMSVVMGISDRIAVLHFGEKIAEGSPEAIRSDPKVLDAYLGGADE